ncbi:MAG: hypothetical protein V9G42_01115 [Bacteroidia bacterium]|jgi:hypothetical protein
MKKQFLFVITLIVVYTSSYSQSQLNHWYISPKKMDMSLSPPIPSTISPTFGGVSAATVVQVANGMYDKAGNLLFYVSDGGVYDYNNTLIGSLNNGGTEIIIVPFGDNDTINNCHRKFNVFTTSGGFTSATSLWRAEVDLNSLSVTSTLVDTINYYGNTGTEFGAIAVGRVTSSKRYLYFLAGPGTTNSTAGGIKKVTIKNDGSVTLNGRIYPTVANPNNNTGAEVFAQELDLSPDGKWLAWGSYAMVNHQSGTQFRYHILELDASGDYLNNSYKRFNIPNYTGNNTVSDFRGIEFYQSGNTTKLFVGAGIDGIFYINLPWSNWSSYPTPPPASDFTQISGSSGTNLSTYGKSQIELAYNGRMYAACNPSGNMYNMGSFDPQNSIPQILGNNFSFTLSNVPGGTWGTSFYTLPDQIDGQDYSAITPSVSAQVVTTHTLNYPDNAITNQSTTWSYGISNPLGVSVPIHVTGELRIRQNSNLIISGMTFKFSPEAKVIVEPGSTLTLTDGTLLTSNFMGDPCNVAYTWQGVEVWGSQSNQSQNILPLAVGKLTIKNNSTIEYAICGARAQKFYNPAVNLHRGGIIVATTGATFKNCIMDVEFLPYINLYNGKNYGNRRMKGKFFIM